MASEVTNKDEGSTNNKVIRNYNRWKFPKIPVHKLYYKHPCKIFPTSYSIRDYKRTMTIKSSDELQWVDLLSYNFLKGFVKKKHNFLHLGLVQVAIKPLVRDGLETPILVFIQDRRHRDNLKNSLLAAVRCDLAQGPFYFNCFPSFSVSLSDLTYKDDRVLYLGMKTTGIPKGVSLALRVRVVCKAMVDLRAEYLEEPVFGMTNYFNAISGEMGTTYWDRVFQFSSNESGTNND